MRTLEGELEGDAASASAAVQHMAADGVLEARHCKKIT
jgi:hypothetical protein